MEWINFRQLYAFWMVCKNGGFNNAAKKMFVSQSAISDHIAQLEEYLDEKLFDRTTRSVKITRVGGELLKYAEYIFSQSREINEVLRDKKDSQTIRTLKVGMVGGISRNFVYRSLSKILSNNPVMKIDVVSGAYEEMVYLLRTYELDLAISLDVPRMNNFNNFEFTEIGASKLCLAGKKKLINQVRQPQDKSVNIFSYKYFLKGELFQRVLRKNIGPNFNLQLETDDISLLRFFANSGEGLVLIPEIGVHEDISNKTIEKIILKDLPSITFNAIYLKDGFHRDMISKLF